jgi:hypothetical protein
MATTTNYGWATPDDTDLVKDGAAAIRTLGTSIDTSFAADEGDLLIGGTSDIFEALPIGAAGTVLTSDGDTADWAAVSSLEPFLVAPVTGNFISSRDAWSSQSAPANDKLYYQPIYLPSATYDRIGIRTGASHSGNTTVRLGLYNVGSNGRPTTVFADFGTVVCNATSTNFLITINQTIPGGYYYLANVTQGQTGVGQLSFGSGESNPSVRVGTGFNANYFAAFEETGVSGALPTAGTLIHKFDTYGVAMRFA